MRRSLVTMGLLFVLSGVALGAPPYRLDDPLLVDPDRLDTPVKPASVEYSDYYDRFSHTFADLGASDGGEAANVNTLDEVPNSSWFTNRRFDATTGPQTLMRGPNRVDGPDTSRSWLIVRSKTQGVTIGFHIEDARGDRYVIKLDPATGVLNSASEVIATKLFYALGYHVPENYIVHLTADQLRIAPGTTVTDEFGDKTPMTKTVLERLLRHAPRMPDGTIRAVASRYVEGEPIGPWRYHGTRSDDPNDVVPHEDRRELRGMRLFAAWINHDDARSQNTLSSWVRDGDRRYVRHYMIDFGSAFGSGNLDLIVPNVENYWLEGGDVLRSLLGLGLRVPPYRRVDWPRHPDFPQLGRWQADHFDPDGWRPDYPNPAFVRMTPRDAFWAAKRVMMFTPHQLRAIVKTGQFLDPAAEQFFYETLLARQRAIGERYLLTSSPVDAFRVEQQTLMFDNLAELHGLTEQPSVYQGFWHSLNNDTGERTLLGPPETVRTPELAIPGGVLPIGDEWYLVVRVEALNAAFPVWSKGVDVVLRRTPAGFRVVAVER